MRLPYDRYLYRERRYSFGETIDARGKSFSRLKDARKREINNRDHCQGPKPARETAPLVMPDSSGDDTGERHREHEFPGEIHDLIDASARQRSTDPDIKNKMKAAAPQGVVTNQCGRIPKE